ncbi:MAG: DapH/DapD/GlmU-related protein, partial [Pseudomonadales bacterium]
AAKISIRDNVWIGDGVTVCKGVTIGTNSVIGTGSVVTKDIPANVIAAGNPATVVKPLDPGTQLVGRDALLADAQALELATDNMDKYLLGNNTWLNWLRTLVKPRRGD